MPWTFTHEKNVNWIVHITQFGIFEILEIYTHTLIQDEKKI